MKKFMKILPRMRKVDSTVYMMLLFVLNNSLTKWQNWERQYCFAFGSFDFGGVVFSSYASVARKDEMWLHHIFNLFFIYSRSDYSLREMSFALNLFHDLEFTSVIAKPVNGLREGGGGKYSSLHAAIDRRRMGVPPFRFDVVIQKPAVHIFLCRFPSAALGMLCIIWNSALCFWLSLWSWVFPFFRGRMSRSRERSSESTRNWGDFFGTWSIAGAYRAVGCVSGGMRVF